MSIDKKKTLAPWRIIGMAVLVGALMGDAELGAQSVSYLFGVPDLGGHWVNRTPRFDCGGLTDDNGEPRIQCSIPVSELLMNARALAWQEFVDESLSPKYDCVGASLPNLFMDPPVWRLLQQGDRVLMEYEKDSVVRTVWMDGRSHPPPTEVFYHGHSIGRYEGETLVVETTNFTFDPDGLDDMGHIPSSTRKRLIERYSLRDPDHLRLEVTIEDPLFLSGPFTYELEHERSADDITAQPCDPEAARQPLRMLPQKYPD
jgi:hypothetical protein